MKAPIQCPLAGLLVWGKGRGWAPVCWRGPHPHKPQVMVWMPKPWLI